ncbi:FHA domain-containing protein [Haliangium ochraceum]|uniref:FHA domain containing protein n=1 Tax=Haliangium ochraceum (strain DSM 14365 / JCM 11303 / SMP-2) TaxID=502025 RepID=D0LV43_HALO1|nr:FHA domain-containing protein [Haliangium ochraceum]ACY15884.1 FHA domain containing protein [Haliangium ochraceum DSM 14365]
MASAAPWLRVDRVEAEPSVFPDLARLQLFVTAVDLHGVILGDLTGERDWKLEIASKATRAPLLLGTFAGLEHELAVALVIETGAPFAEALPAIRQQALEFLQKLPRDARVVVVGYDDEVHASRRVGDVARARRDIEALEINPLSTELQLIEAVNRARDTLARLEPEREGVPMRKLIAVVSDGRDADPSPENYRRVAKRAARNDIRIHTIGFPADRNRYPLYGLAEMSKQSEGTFRLVLTESAFGSHFGQLAREINEQYVLTYFLPAEDIERKRVELHAGGMVSNSPRVPAVECGGESCEAGQMCVARRCTTPPQASGGGFFGVLASIAGVLFGLLVLVGLVGVIMGLVQKRRKAAAAAGEAPAPAPGEGEAAGEPAAEAAPAVQRVVAYDAHGRPIQAPAHGRAGSHADVAAAGASASWGHAAAGGAGASAGFQAAAHTGNHQAYAGQQNTGQHRAAAQHTGQHHTGPAPSLLILSGPRQGQRVPLHHGFVIGTAQGCHLLLQGDTFASSHHAHVLMDTAGGCVLVDRDSTNGTYVNGVRTREKRLAHGMLIKIGATEARFLTQ